MDEDAIRIQLKSEGYKRGRITQLLMATRASGSRDQAPNMAMEAPPWEVGKL